MDCFAREDDDDAVGHQSNCSDSSFAHQELSCFDQNSEIFSNSGSICSSMNSTDTEYEQR